MKKMETRKTIFFRLPTEIRDGHIVGCISAEVVEKFLKSIRDKTNEEYTLIPVPMGFAIVGSDGRVVKVE